MSGKRVLVLGATGTIGRATVRALVARGHEVVCFVRNLVNARALLPDVSLREGDICDPISVSRDAFRGESFDGLVSCLASRTGSAKDAWAIDYHAHSHALAIAGKHGVRHMVLLSAICVQKPRLEFQRAKLAFESDLIASGMTYSIIRPTAFFKSLSGQVARVKAGKPFLLFGDGRLTACKPISDDDLAAYIADCFDDEARWNRVLPIGGPGPAITPREQGEILFALVGRPPNFQSVPVWLLQAIRACLAGLGCFNSKLADKAELAGIGLYYATESMLIFDPEIGRYNADATPSTGSQTLADYYHRLARGEISDDRRDHAVF